MIESLDNGKNKGHNLPRSSLVFRRDGDLPGRLSPPAAVLLSLLSWPDPQCPKLLKPVMVLTATAIWLGLAVLTTKIGRADGFWPWLPLGGVFLLAGFVGGSRIAMLAAALFLLGVNFGFWNSNLSDLTRDMFSSGYPQKDFVVGLVFTWLCGVPHWRRKFSWFFTLLWGLGVVFAPVIYIVINIYGFYGELPESAVTRYLNRELLLAWGVTVITAAVLAKLLYFLKDFLRRTLS